MSQDQVKEEKTADVPDGVSTDSTKQTESNKVTVTEVPENFDTNSETASASYAEEKNLTVVDQHKNETIKDSNGVVEADKASESTNQEKTTGAVLKEDGTADTSRMIPAPKPEIKIIENIPNAMPEYEKKYLIKSLKTIKRIKDAAPFLAPVDIVQLQIPFYYNFIPHPMDLSTIEHKLLVNAYESPKLVQDDFNLMVNNCVKFNGEKSSISRMATNIQASFEKQLLHLPTGNSNNSKKDNNSAGNGARRELVIGTNSRPKREIHPPKPKDMPYDITPRNKRLLADLRFATQVVKELTSKKHEGYSYPFLQPVDPVALNCPQYFDYIKEPMDLSTIQNKLQNNLYNSIEDFEYDMSLIFKNCYIFNPEGTPVNLMGHKLQSAFKKRWAEKPLPPPVKEEESDDNDYDSDDDYEDDIDENSIKVDEKAIRQSVVNNQAIMFLEQQIERMKKDLEKMKKDEYEKARKKAVASQKKLIAKRRSSGVSKGNKQKRSRKGGKVSGNKKQKTVELTFAMKKELSEKMADLSDKKLQHVMKIINESVPDLPNENQEEIELDMDQLDESTILKLYNYVIPKNVLKKNGNSGRKKNQGNKIDILKQRLKEYDDTQKQSISSMQSESSEGEDDDSDESESSEEE